VARVHARAALVLALVLLAPRSARAGDEGPPDPRAGEPEPPRVVLPIGEAARIALSGYLEASYTYDANRPPTREVNDRFFDARSDEITLSNAALGIDARFGGVYGHAMVQYGLTPRLYYAQEPQFSALQEVYAGYEVPVDAGLWVDAGLYLSPLGLEGLAVKEEWNWSRSNIWTALPTYAFGARAAYVLPRGYLRLAIYNGWNRIIDDNKDKTFGLEWRHKLTPDVTLTSMYVAGVERETGAPEGRAFRQLFDTFVRARFGPRLEGLAYTDFGAEPNNFGLSGWASYALYARARVFDWLYTAARGDIFFEKIPPGARPIFWPTPTRWIGSLTFTLDLRPSDTLSVRLEARQDEAAVPVLNAADAPRKDRTTFTLGVTTWF
jgi:hypothetical protein